MANKVVSDTAFRDEIVELDGIDFDRCSFAGCRLVYRGGNPFTWLDCTDIGTVEFRDAAGRTLSTLRMLWNCHDGEVVDAMLASIRTPIGGKRH